MDSPCPPSGRAQVEQCTGRWEEQVSEQVDLVSQTKKKPLNDLLFLFGLFFPPEGQIVIFLKSSQRGQSEMDWTCAAEG